jgi:hypothetical protein
MPHQEPALPENDPLKRPKMLKEHFFCPRSHIIGRMTKKNSTKKKTKKIPKSAEKSPKCPQKSQNGMEMSIITP